MPNGRLENVKIVSEVIRNIVVALAVIIGGIWALATFISLEEVRAAQEESAERQEAIAKLQLDSQKVRKELERQTRVQMIMSSEQFTVPNDSRHYVLSTVTLKNVGNLAARLRYDFEGIPPLCIRRLDLGKEGDFSPMTEKSFDTHEPICTHAYTVPATATSSIVGWQVARPEQVYEIPFLVRVPEPGLYLAAFRVYVGYDEDEQKIYKDRFGIEARHATWSARDFVIVE